jgi:hypothetical protein
LGNAVHAIQDSYAEGHVTRKKEGNDYIIVDLLIYDDANKKPTANWPGHAALDQRWKTSELGKEAVIATRELVRIVVVSSLQKTEPEFRVKWSSLWDTYVSVFLQYRFSAAASR